MSDPTAPISLRVAAFTGGRAVPSARFRVRQLISPLRQLGVDVQEYVARLGSYPPDNRMVRPAWAAATLLSRLPDVLTSRRHDMTLLQREMVSMLYTLEPLTRSPRVLDLDDAVWLNREAPIRRLVSISAGVVCGNSFIADWVSSQHDRVAVIPTAVDSERFVPLPDVPEQRIIGWSGLHAGAAYLLGVERALKLVLDRYPSYRLRVVSNIRPKFRHLRPDQVEFIRWSEAVEVATMQEMTVGIMPLADSEWVRGKCSYKMLLYMSCGIPVVVSPFGMNGEVLSLADVGLGPRTEDEWVDALSWMIEHHERRAAMGDAGRRVIVDRFSIDVVAPKLARFLRSID